MKGFLPILFTLFFAFSFEIHAATEFETQILPTEGEETSEPVLKETPVEVSRPSTSSSSGGAASSPEIKPSNVLLKPPAATRQYKSQEQEKEEDCIPDPLYLGSQSDKILSRDLMGAEESRDTALQSLLRLFGVGEKTEKTAELLSQLGALDQNAITKSLDEERSDIAGTKTRCLQSDISQNVLLTN